MSAKKAKVTHHEDVTTYKGFDNTLKCRDFQYEVGKTYTHDGEVMACSAGFHACEYPLDVFAYYPPASSRFAVVKQGGKLSRHDTDSKVASSTIKVSAEIGLSGLIEEAIEYTCSRAKPENTEHSTGYQSAASSTGARGAASSTGARGAASSTGDEGAASSTGTRGAASSTGARGAASSTGYQSAASSTGTRGAASSTGDEGAAMASGYRGKVCGAEGNALFLVERNAEYRIVAVWAGIVGRDGIKADTWYSLRAGKPVEAAKP